MGIKEKLTHHPFQWLKFRTLKLDNVIFSYLLFRFLITLGIAPTGTVLVHGSKKNISLSAEQILVFGIYPYG